MNDLIVSMPIERYEYFITLEARINLAVNAIYNDGFANKETILRIIGTKAAIEKANELREKLEKKN